MKEKIIVNKGEKIVCRVYKKNNCKKMNLRVSADGIVKVSLPKYLPYLCANNFIHDNLEWIEKKLVLSKLQKKSYNYLGDNIRLVKIIDANIKDFNYILKNNILTVYTSNESISEYDIYINWLKLKANEYIPRRVEELSKRYNFIYNKINIKNLNSQWGSCSQRKNLSFNLKLMYFNSKVIDYVIIHELCHLKEMNHSKRFWKNLESIIPNYKQYKEQLNNIT